MAQILVNPSGETWEIGDDAEAAQLLENGWQPEAPEAAVQRQVEAKYGDQPIRTAIESGLDEATFGLSTLAETKLLGVDPADIKGRQTANPAADVVGRGVGLVGTVALGPGGLVAKAGTRAAGALGLKGLSAAAAAGLVEGGFYGAGRAVSEDALAGPEAEVTAEKLLSHIGGGALLGAGGGVVGTAASKAIGAGLKKAAGITEDAGNLPAYFRQKAEGNAVRAIGDIGPTSGDLKGLDPERVQRIGRTILDEKLIGASSEQLEAARNAAWQRMEKVLLEADAAGEARKFDLTPVARRIRNEILPELQGDPALGGIRNEIERYADEYAEAAAQGGVPFARANTMKANIRDAIPRANVSKVDDRVRMRMASIIDDEIESQIRIGVGGDAVKEFQAAKRLYGDLREAEKITMRAEQRVQGNRSISLTDYITGASALGGTLASGQLTGGVVTGGVFSLANRWARSKGSAAMAKALDALAENKGLARIAKAFHGRVNSLVTETPDVFGLYAPFVSAAAARSPMEFLAEHAVASEEDPGYRAAMEAAGFPAQEPGEEGASYGLATGLSAVQQVAEDHDKALGASISGFLERKRPGRREKTPSAKEYRAEFEDLATLVASPQALAERIDPGGELASVAPQVAAQVAATAAKAAQFLHDKAPKPPLPPAVPDYGAREWRPAMADLDKYRRYGRAVMRPLSVLEDLQRGELSREAAEGLRFVYPRLAEDISKRFLEGIAERKAKLTYQQRLQLSVLLGMPLDDSQKPEAWRAHQAVYAQAQLRAPKPKPPGPQGFKAPDFSTMSQRMEGPR